jgi:hypothetical protein
MPFSFDYQIHLSDLILIGSGIVAFLKIFIWNRDILRELTAETKDLRLDVNRIETRQDVHHEWLIGNGLDLRTGRDRRQP